LWATTNVSMISENDLWEREMPERDTKPIERTDQPLASRSLGAADAPRNRDAQNAGADGMVEGDWPQLTELELAVCLADGRPPSA